MALEEIQGRNSVMSVEIKFSNALSIDFLESLTCVRLPYKPHRGAHGTLMLFSTIDHSARFQAQP